MCNCGDEAAEVTLEKAHYDADGIAQTQVTARDSAVVLTPPG